MIVSCDTETTGLYANSNSMIEIAMVPLDPVTFLPNGQPVFHEFIQPWDGCVLEKEALVINGTWQGNMPDSVDYLIKRGLSAQEFASKYMQWLSNCGVKGTSVKPLGHNWMFDFGMIETWLFKNNSHLQGRLFDREQRCSKNLAISMNDLLKTKLFPRVSLKALCDHFKISNDDAHTALADAIRTARVYNALVNL